MKQSNASERFTNAPRIFLRPSLDVIISRLARFARAPDLSLSLGGGITLPSIIIGQVPRDLEVTAISPLQASAALVPDMGRGLSRRESTGRGVIFASHSAVPSLHG